MYDHQLPKHKYSRQKYMTDDMQTHPTSEMKKDTTAVIKW